MEKQLNLKYAASQALYSSLIATILAFASIYLLDKGLTNTSIGAILSLSSIASIIIQTFFANMIERIPSLHLQDMLVILLFVVILSASLLLFGPSLAFFLLAIFVAYSFAQSTAPFVNSLAFEYEDQGILINYGKGRAYGSLAYAIATLVVGFVIEATSPSILPFFYIGFSIFFLLIVRSYKLPDDFKAHPGGIDSKREKSVVSVSNAQQPIAYFIQKYRVILYIILGYSFAQLAQTMLATFMIQIVTPIGGHSGSVGFAIFLAAIVEVPVLMKFDTLLTIRPVTFWLKLAFVFYIVKVVLVFLATNVTFLYISQLFQAGSFGLAYPAVVHFIKENVEKRDLIKGQTLFTVGITLSNVLASFIGGLLLDQLGVTPMLGFSIIITGLGAFIIYKVLYEVANEAAEITSIKRG